MYYNLGPNGISGGALNHYIFSLKIRVQAQGVVLCELKDVFLPSKRLL